MKYYHLPLGIIFSVLGGPTVANAQSINECLKITLEEPSGSYRTETVGIRATNDCKDALYFSYVVCSSEEIFSHGGGITNLYKQDSARNLIVPQSTTYKYSQAGGFTYLKGSGDYNFRYKASYKPMSSLPRCKPPQSQSSASNAKRGIDMTDCMSLSGNHVVNSCDITFMVKAWTVGGGCLQDKAKTLRLRANGRANAGFTRACGTSNWNAFAVGCDEAAYKRGECDWNLLRKKNGFPLGGLQRW